MKRKNRKDDRKSSPVIGRTDTVVAGEAIPLSKARVCADCDCVFGKGRVSCPQCGGTSWFHLSQFVPAMNTPDPDEQAARSSYIPAEPAPGTVGEAVAAKDAAFLARLHATRFPVFKEHEAPRPWIVRLWTRAVGRFRPDAEIAL